MVGPGFLYSGESGYLAATARLNALRQVLSEREIDAFFVTNLSNIRYLVGFTGTAGLLLIVPDEVVFFTDFRYDEQAHAEVAGSRIEVKKGTLLQAMARDDAARGIAKMAFEGADLKYASFEQLQELLPGRELSSAVGIVEGLRLRKDEEEVRQIRAAVELGDRVFGEICELAKPGMTEIEIAAEIDCRMRRAGAQAPAFDTIVASGPRSSVPHAKPTRRRVSAGDFVVLDLGAYIDGYASDLTRTLVVGSPSAEQQQIYATVQRAQREALEVVRSGITAAEADSTARALIDMEGYGDRFGHGLGHGVGLEVHEGPKLSQESKDTLETGMVVTIEPGIYIPGWGGVRIEDMVVITDDGCEVLTRAPKDLIAI